MKDYENNKAEKITFIYIHGIDQPDINVFNKNTERLHKEFIGKKFGKYEVTADYKKIYWGNLPLESKSYEIYKEGLIGINSEHNMSNIKKTVKPRFSFLVNPIVRFFLIGDWGSKSTAVFYRNYINIFAYHLIWVIVDMRGHTEIFNSFEKAISEIDGKYAIVAHSLGSAISTKYIDTRVMLEPNEPNYNEKVSNNFVGLITGGDVNNTFLSLKFARDLTSTRIDPYEKNLIKYFADNGKFWISCNHCNDLFASKLSNEITSYKNIPGSGIVSFITRKHPFQSMLDYITFNKKNRNIFTAHQYMYNNSKSFAKNVLNIYEKSFENN